MNQKIKKYRNLILLCSTNFLLPLKWYTVPYADETLSYSQKGITGWNTLTSGLCMCLIVFLLCLVVQYMVIKEKKYYIIAIFLQIIYVIILMIHPFQRLGINVFSGSIYVYRVYEICL